MFHIYLAMSRAYFWDFLFKIHPKYGTSNTTTVFTGIVVSLLTGFIPLYIIAKQLILGHFLISELFLGCVFALHGEQRGCLWVGGPLFL